MGFSKWLSGHKQTSDRKSIAPTKEKMGTESKQRRRIVEEKKMIPPDEKKKVLIVESNDRMAEAFQRRLQEAGLDARTTWSGHEALALLQSNEFDVLLMDDYLPDLHATDFLERLSRLPLQPWVVVMRGRLASASVRRYRELGASSVVNKADLAQVVQAVLACCAEESLAKTSA
jgi:CheY-like chemotaxis protein